MLSRMIAVGRAVLTVVLGSAAVVGQQMPATSSSSGGLEFPVIMRQNVAAGKTLVGTKVQAELVVATLVDGVVIPREAILSGEVTESVAKSASEPSRLALRMDSAQWKKGSAPIKVYLTAWFYPEAMMTSQNLSYEPADSGNAKKNWNGMGTYPDPNNPISQGRFPGRDSDKDTTSTAASPSSSISKHRVLMKNIESTNNSAGAVILTSSHANIKLDKVTTYVLASGDLLPKK
jgi:hypothetical protein